MSIRQIILISRPRFWIYLVGPYLIGLVAAGEPINVTVILLGLYLTLPANILIYGINDIYDRATDKLNIKKDTYEHRLKDNQVGILYRVILAINLPFIICLAWLLPTQSLGWLALFLFSGVGYSARPLRFKTKPVLDAISNILYVAPGLAVFVAQTATQPSWQAVLACLLWCMAMHAYSAVPDIRADRQSHTSTIATWLGAPKTLLFCAICYAGAAIFGYQFVGIFSIIAGLIYAVVIGWSYVVVAKPKELFRVYTLFPVINSLIGTSLFFVVFYR